MKASLSLTILLLSLFVYIAPARVLSLSPTGGTPRRSMHKVATTKSTPPPPPLSTIYSPVATRIHQSFSLPVVGMIFATMMCTTALPPPASTASASAAAATKADLEVLANSINSKFDAVNNKIDAQQNMFVLVPIVSVAISGATTIFNTMKTDEIKEILKELKGVKEDIKEDLKEDLKQDLKEDLKQDLKKDLRLDSYGSAFALAIFYGIFMATYGK